LQEAAAARHAARFGCRISDDDWRLAIWHEVKSAQRFNIGNEWLGPTPTQASLLEVSATVP
jgi:hypothetical protein